MVPDQDVAWSRAFALQALSDLRAMDTLREAESERCHWLHFLQMAAEKVCKAHLALDGHERVRKVHNYTSGTFPVIAKVVLSADGAKNVNRSWQLESIKKFSREMEVLAPAVNEKNARPDNCEYPWETADKQIVVPCLHSFPGISDRRTLTLVIRVLRTAAERYASAAASAAEPS